MSQVSLQFDLEKTEGVETLICRLVVDGGSQILAAIDPEVVADPIAERQFRQLMTGFIQRRLKAAGAGRVRTRRVGSSNGSGEGG